MDQPPEHACHLHQSGAETPGRIDFSDKFERLVARSGIDSTDISVATVEEVTAAVAMASTLLPISSLPAVLAIRAHNPECFRIVRSGPLGECPMMAWLPLNALGAAALVDDRFDGTAPSLQHVCRSGETPEAIYLWLLLTPGRLFSGLRLMKELESYGRGAPIFSRPAHGESARILAMAGFLPAREFFPAAPPWLVVALTAAPDDRQPREIGVRVVRSMDDLARVFSVRTATYMSEQSCSYEEEFDGNDFCATHLLGEIGGEPAGCVRIRYFGDFAKLERLAVKPEHRRSRLMWRLVRAAFDHCARKGFTRLYAHARHDLVPAWERFGARLVEGRGAFHFSDVQFREMQLDLAPRNDAIRFGSDPLLTIRPEGDWDRLGSIGLSQLVSSPARRARNAALCGS